MNKQEKYDELLPQLAALIEGETEEMSVLANVSAALKEHFGWTIMKTLVPKYKPVIVE